MNIQERKPHYKLSSKSFNIFEVTADSHFVCVHKTTMQYDKNQL